MTADTNIGALDAALDAAITYVDLAPVDTVKNYAAGEDSKVFLNAVDKTFSGKSSTVIKWVSARQSASLPYPILLHLISQI